MVPGRIPGFGLSEDGRMMAKAAANYLAERDVVAIFTSPLERAKETAEPLAEPFCPKPVVDERLIEPWNHFEGLVFGVGEGSLKRFERCVVAPQPVHPVLGGALPAGGPADAGHHERRPGRGPRARGGVHEPPLPIWVTRQAWKASGCGITPAIASVRWPT